MAADGNDDISPADDNPKRFMENTGGKSCSIFKFFSQQSSSPLMAAKPPNGIASQLTLERVWG
jgi:hypothetical protein